MIIPFMKLKWASLGISLLFGAGCFYYTFQYHKGFREGLDFAGGIKLEVRKSEKVTVQTLRDFFAKEKLPVVVQRAGKEGDAIKIEIGSQEAVALDKKGTEIREILAAKELAPNSVGYLQHVLHEHFHGTPVKKGKGTKQAAGETIEFLNINQVGPTVGTYLRDSATKLLVIALLLITVYVAFRFRINYALGAMLSLIHDLFLTIGMIGVLQISLSIPVIAALLTILGYSINDTIVIFDRIRENAGQDKVAMDSVINRSISETMSRTINTAVTTIISIVAVYFLGGEGLEDMALVLILGIVLGTYSSVFVASPIVVIANRLLPGK